MFTAECLKQKNPKTPDKISLCINSGMVSKLWCVYRKEFDSNIQKNQLDLYLLTGEQS